MKGREKPGVFVKADAGLRRISNRFETVFDIDPYVEVGVEGNG